MDTPVGFWIAAATGNVRRAVAEQMIGEAAARFRKRRAVERINVLALGVPGLSDDLKRALLRACLEETRW